MVSRAVLDLMVRLGLPAALVATGCFDVHGVEAGPLIIDDFEGTSLHPTDPTFDAWGCGKFPIPADDSYGCGRDGPGFQSDHALSLDAAISDPMDGIQQEGGAFLQTVATTTKDLTRFSQLVFAARLDSSGLPPLSQPTLDVQIGCNSAALDGPRPGAVYVSLRTEPVGNDWQVLKVELGDLAAPTWPNTRILERGPGCLKVADTLRFAVSAGLPDGHSGTLVLHIDDVELE